MTMMDDFTTTNIKTQMITATTMLTALDALLLLDEKKIESGIKEKLALQIANYILENDLVLFTKQKDLLMDSTIYRARAFLANKEDITIIMKSDTK